MIGSPPVRLASRRAGLSARPADETPLHELKTATEQMNYSVTQRVATS